MIVVSPRPFLGEREHILSVFDHTATLVEARVPNVRRVRIACNPEIVILRDVLEDHGLTDFHSNHGRTEAAQGIEDRHGRKRTPA